ncbi:hypothetical protein Acr_12g0000370 [Actinidia rufa]|uniref:Retrotransposon gag domain-containing protein n=1 Tax=Actinidia rufa TaxID=165716 RepID=A0A7J0FGD6_9ERIC|nr:hypothetical protein Acr_12g0000370 [Actinidia rufa]
MFVHRYTCRSDTSRGSMLRLRSNSIIGCSLQIYYNSLALFVRTTVLSFLCLYREMHGMAKQIRIANKNNARLIQHLVIANPLPPAAPHVPEIQQSRHSGDDESQSHQNTGRATRWRCQLPSTSPSEKRTLPRQNLGHPIELQKFIQEPDITLGIHRRGNVKAFSATLKGSARIWFRKLSPGTIDSFCKLSRLFIANFMSCRVRQKSVPHLFTIHQKDGESLKEYVKHFNQVVLEVEDASDKVVIMAMMKGLRPYPLFNSLSKNIPATLLVIQSKTDKYIIAEESTEAKRRRRGNDNHKRKDSPH